MNEKEEDIIGKTYDQLTEYIQLRLQLLKIETAENTAKVAAFLISTLILVVIGFFCLLFMSIVAGFYFSELLGSTFYGFGIIGGIYLLLFLILLLVKNLFIKRPVMNSVIRLFFNQHETNQDN